MTPASGWGRSETGDRDECNRRQVAPDPLGRQSSRRGRGQRGDGSARRAWPGALDFDNATIYWTPQTGAHEVHGDIRVKWARTRWLGYPLTDETGTPDGIGRFNHFENGSIYWTPAIGPHEVHGLIRDFWAKQGWERGPAGYPISDEFNDPSKPGGRQSRFQHGTIRWSPAAGASFHAGVPID